MTKKRNRKPSFLVVTNDFLTLGSIFNLKCSLNKNKTLGKKKKKEEISSCNFLFFWYFDASLGTAALINLVPRKMCHFSLMTPKPSLYLIRCRIKSALKSLPSPPATGPLSPGRNEVRIAELVSGTRSPP